MAELSKSLDTKMNFLFSNLDPDAFLMRQKVEIIEEWIKWKNLIPFLTFDSDWEVKSIPPYAGILQTDLCHYPTQFVVTVDPT